MTPSVRSVLSEEALLAKPVTKDSLQSALRPAVVFAQWSGLFPLRAKEKHRHVVLLFFLISFRARTYFLNHLVSLMRGVYCTRLGSTEE